MSFAPLDHPIVFDEPVRLTDVDSWHEHIPFAFFAIASLRPSTFVELGTWKGDSYCAFCQAVKTLELPTRCHAVDTWAGDEHTGPYGPEALDDLREHHDPRYGAFSTLVQQTFDDAAPRFGDGSIDLLHIDGAHSYEAVRNDVERWLPKLSDRGVLLLHDTAVHSGGFGVWRLWDELVQQRPGFAFAHGHGLGVLAVGPEVDRAFSEFLSDARRDTLASLFFAALGGRFTAAEHRIEAAELSAMQAAKAAELVAERKVEVAESAREAAERSAERWLDDASRARAELARAEAERERLRLERNRLEVQVREREADLERVIDSVSWRATEPLRRAKRESHRLRRVLWRARMAKARRSSGEPPPRPDVPPADLASLRHRPLVSILMPVFDTDPEWLGRAVESVRSQIYPHWQLCIADDGSTNAPTRDYLATLVDDSAITVICSPENRGIAAATNSALEAASGEFVAFLDHDDELAPEALLECVRVIDERPDVDVVYSDEDKIDRHGRRSAHHLKPDWSPEFFRGVMYVGHLLVIRRSLVEQAGGLDSDFDGVQDYELMLRVSELTERIEHVPRILYHWRTLPQSTASSTDAKDGISALQAQAVGRHLERIGVAATARPNPRFPHRVIVAPERRDHWPRDQCDRPDAGRAAAPRALPDLDLRAVVVSRLRGDPGRHRDDGPGCPTAVRGAPGGRDPV